MESNKNSFENLLKDKLDNHELPYDQNDWLKLEKDLPKINGGNSGNISGSVLKIAAVIGISAIAVISLIYFVNNNNAKKNVTQLKQQNAVQANVVVNQNNTVSAVAHSVNHTEKVEHINNVINNKIDPKVTVAETNKQPVGIVSFQNIPSVETKNVSKIDVDITAKQNVVPQIPNVMFSVDITEGCEPLKVTFIPSVKCDSIEYIWDFGNGETSSLLNPVYTYNSDGAFNPKLSVKYKKSRIVSSFNLEQPIVVKSAPTPEFVIENLSGIYVFTNRTVNSAKVKWVLANGEESTDEIAKQSYKMNGTYNITMIATGQNNCSASLMKSVKVDVFAAILFPNAFTPDGDGRNDCFYPLGENLADYQYEMAIFNRFGQLVFETKDIKVQWNGKVKGSEKIADTGVYAYEAIFKDKYGNSTRKTGSVSLLKTK